MTDDLSSEIIENKISNERLKESYIKILKIVMPIIPHFASECLSEISPNEKLDWPKADKKYLQVKKKVIVIQINGKKRSLISSENSFSEKDIIKKIKKTTELQKFIGDKKIIKTIFIKDKLINLIIK